MNRSRAAVWALVVLLLPQLQDSRALGWFGYRPTLREEAAQAQLIFYARLAHGGGGDGKGWTLAIEDVIKNHPILGKQKALPLGREMPAVDPANPPRILVFGDVFKGKVDFYRGLVASPAVAGYLKGLLALKPEDRVGQLRYCFPFLEHPDQEIAQDAHLEFGNASAAEIGRAAARVSPEKLRAWLQDKQTKPYRLGLYALMLGHCGADGDAGLLRRLLEKDVKKSSGAGVDRLLIGYTLLRPREGGAYLRDLLKDPETEFRIRNAGLRVLDFLATTRRDVLTKKEILNAVEGLLDQPDIADSLIVNLYQWRYWDLTPRVLALWGRETHKANHIQRGILFYALQCPDAQAVRFVDELRRQNPQKVEEAEELLRVQERLPEKGP